MEKLAPVRAVFGNIDGTLARKSFPLHNRFILEDVDVWITHIGGYPNRYDKKVVDDIKRNPPTLFITGHSHILKVIYDKNLQLLHMNPGAAGKHGFHKVKTLLRFDLNNGKVENVEVIELGSRTT